MNALQLVSTLSPLEIRDLRKWGRSEWFNLRADMLPFFELVLKSAASPKRSFSKEKIWAQLYPDRPFNDSAMRSMGAWLTDLIEDYWVWQAAEADRTGQKLRLSQAYERHGLPAHGERALAQAHNLLEAGPQRNHFFWKQKFELGSEAFRRESGERTANLAHFEALTESLDLFFIAEKLRLACVMASQQAFQKTGIRIGFLTAVFEEIEARNLTEIPAVGVYFFAYKTLTEAGGSGENLRHLRQLLTESGHFFPPDELKGLYLALLNFCIPRMNQGQIEWQQTAFDLYREGIERRILYENGQISPFTYRNVVAIGVLLGEFAWVRGFLDRHKNDLEPAARESTHALALARLEYAMGRFDAALVLLRDFQPPDVLGQLAAKAIVLKIFFENRSFEALESHLEAMRHFIKRHREIGYHGDHYLNLISFTRQLVRLDFSDAGAVEKWQAEVAATAALTEKSWLLEKSVKQKTAAKDNPRRR